MWLLADKTALLLDGQTDMRIPLVQFAERVECEWLLRFWEFEERRNRNYYEYDIMSARESEGACSLLTSGEIIEGAVLTI